MKRQLSHDELKTLSQNVVDQLHSKYPEQIKNGELFLFAVLRGGMTFAQNVAYRMALPVGVVYPMSEGSPVMMHPFASYKKLTKAVFVYLEDVVAQGRTLTKVMDYHRLHYGDHFAAEFVPAVLDANVDPAIRDQVNIVGTVTNDWIVFPHEEFHAVDEGDRGLFRAGTSNNSKPL